MAFVILDDTGAIAGIFANPQDPEQHSGYAVISDDDPRLLEFQPEKTITRTPAEKLAAAGLTVADLKSLLGLT